jgi:hypothetical protein
MDKSGQNSSSGKTPSAPSAAPWSASSQPPSRHSLPGPAPARPWRSSRDQRHRRPDRLRAEITRLGRYPLIVIDEAGCIPFEPEAASPFFELISARYETASVVVTSTKPVGWGEIFGDDTVVAMPRPSRRHHQPQRRQLPRQEPPPRPHPRPRPPRRRPAMTSPARPRNGDDTYDLIDEAL